MTGAIAVLVGESYIELDELRTVSIMKSSEVVSIGERSELRTVTIMKRSAADSIGERSELRTVSFTKMS